ENGDDSGEETQGRSFHGNLQSKSKLRNAARAAAKDAELAMAGAEINAPVPLPPKLLAITW
ncbi:hypothetical protein ABTM36_20145, partial [Acinetobacter baumannii]